MIKKSWLLLLPFLVVGCTSQSGEPDAASTPPSEPSSTISADAEVEPLRPYDEDPPPKTETASSSAYISRIAMSDSSIEVTWSYDGAAEYHIHRLPLASDDRPESAAMTAENKLHEATDTGRFVDDTVEAGTRYWYGVRALDADGALVAHGWHRADAVTDEEPPSPVGGLEASVENGEVLLSWDEAEENYELHAYRVLRGVNGEEPEAISITWNLDQRTFVDDDPPAIDSVTYAVNSYDFHFNNSESSAVTLDLSG